MEWDPEHELRRSAAEVAWLRGLLLGVAEGLERLATELPVGRGRLLAAAMWLRRRLWQGPPPPDAGDLGVGSGPSRRD